MDVARLTLSLTKWTARTVLGAVVGALFVTTMKDIRSEPGPVREGRPGVDGAFEIIVSERSRQGSGARVRRYVLAVDVLNRGNASIPAFQSSVLYVGMQSFPAEVFDGPAFHDSIFPGFRASGLVGYDIPAGSVPDRVEFDVDGDGVMLVVELDPSKEPP